MTWKIAQRKGATWQPVGASGMSKPDAMEAAKALQRSERETTAIAPQSMKLPAHYSEVNEGLENRVIVLSPLAAAPSQPRTMHALSGRPLPAARDWTEADRDERETNRQSLLDEATQWFMYPVDELPEWLALVMADAGVKDSRLEEFLENGDWRVREETTAQLENASLGQVTEYWKAFWGGEIPGPARF